MTFKAILIKQARSHDGKNMAAMIDFNPNQKQEIMAMLLGAGFEVEDNVY